MQATAPAHVTQSNAAIQSHAVFCRRNLVVAGLLSLFAFVASVAIVLHFGKDVLRVSGAPHYVYQAWSFLHGKWDLDLPPSFIDVVTINGKSYTNYPPFPAILMLPFVAIWGLHTSDVLFTLIVSAVNMALLYLLLEQLRASGLTARGWRENVIWCLFFSFGSITLWLSLGGGLWFTAQIVALGTTLLALLLALRGQYAWAGVALGCAVFSRIALLLTFPLLFYLAWNHAGRERLFERFLVSLRARRPDWTAVPWRRLAPLAGVTLVVVALFMARNAAIFGSPFESGYSVVIAQRYPMITDGVFNLRYVPSNFIAYFVSFPRVMFQQPYDRHPAIDMLNDKVAISVFVTTPLFLLLFARIRVRSPLRVALWLTIGLFVVEALLFAQNGWAQFGARYLVDAYPFAFVLLVMSEIRFDWRVVALGALGIFVNFVGLYQLYTGLMPHV